MDIDETKYTKNVAKDGTITFTPIEQPKPKHRCGDVWITGGGALEIVDNRDQWQLTMPCGGWVYCTPPIDTCRYIGNIFDMAKDEYVKKSDVVAALTIEDAFGDSVLTGDFGVAVSSHGIAATRAALAEIGITATSKE